MPLHFCPKALSLRGGFSTAFLSNSLQQGGRFSSEPVWHGIAASRRCEKGHHGPELLPALGGLCKEELASVIGSTQNCSLMGRLSQKAQLVPLGSPGPGKGFEDPGLLSFLQGFLCPLPMGLSLSTGLVQLWF